MQSKGPLNKLSAAGVLISLGIVFGDIGTSPLYVMKAIMGSTPIHTDLILGGISAVFWTLTLQTTLKYVFLTLRADNRGEGGILSLYALVRRYKKWLVIPAIIGGSTLLADGIITPPISVTSAIEGLKLISPNVPVVPIVMVIITLLFIFQRFGTHVVGRFFGPIMILWFLMLGTLGFISALQYPYIFKALNPYYIQFLFQQPGGFFLLGAVFLCTTGAEALYSDLGHCGRKNIQVSWLFVKLCLFLNYAGQGAWLMAHRGMVVKPVNGVELNPFYEIMPDWFRLTGVIIATAATIIASQALITGSYTLISEAIRLNLWPKVKLIYTNDSRGQVYIPSINTLLMFGCLGIVLYFKESSNMEAAYGLAITLTMIMTTVLLNFYMRFIKFNKILVWILTIFFIGIEISFLVANMEKFPNGGYVTLAISIFLVAIMYSWFKARKIKNQYTEFTDLAPYLPMLREISEDESIPKYATNLVFLTSADRLKEIETKIVYSIFNKAPKRADVYWFVHVDVLDDPHTKEYSVEFLESNKVIKVNFRLGFRIEPTINSLFRVVVDDLTKSNEVDVISRYNSLRKYNITGDFRFVVIERMININESLKGLQRIVMTIYEWLKQFSISEEKAFGLDTSMVTTEKVPLITIKPKTHHKLQRLNRENYKDVHTDK
ncbi:MAG: KUP/HAK/KT family potassium transporter [Bacteroidota bacterium]|nr:KUP/HAK/KT family potassium transporter [Bacteroidota bacterium]